MLKTQLNKEYFDRKFNAIDKKFEGTDKEIGTVKASIKSDNDELKALVKSEIEELARMTSKGFEDVIKRLDYRERIERLEKEMGKVREALNL